MARNNLIIRLGAQVSGAVAGLKKVTGGLADLGRKAAAIALKGVATALAGIAAAGAGVAAAGSRVLKLGANAEKTRLAFQTMLGSVAAGDAMMEKLDRFSNSTPYSGDQVNRAAKTLLGFGVAAGNVEGVLRKVGDVAAGSGKDFNDLAAIYGKVFAKGKADSEALNQMVEAGIPIVKLLGEMYGKSGDAIYDMASKGQISAADVSKAFDKMSGKGGVYADMMKKQSETMSGMWDAVVGQLEYAGSMIGEMIAPLVKEVLTVFQGWADEIVAMCKDGRMVEYLATIGYTAVSVGAGIARVFLRVKEYGAATFGALLDFGKAAWDGIAGSAQVGFGYLMVGLVGLWEQIKAVFTVIGRIFRMAFDGLVLAGLSAFNGIINGFRDTINAMIEIANKIPGVNIDLVGKPDFLVKSEKMAKDAADRAAADWQAITTGKDFKDADAETMRKARPHAAMVEAGNAKIDRSADAMLSGVNRFSAAAINVEKGSRSIDAFADKANRKIEKWQSDRLKEQADRKKATDSGKAATKAAAQSAAAISGKTGRSAADSLAKIGLYTFGRGSVGSLDIERNRLLKQLIAAVSVKTATVVVNEA